MLSDRRNCGHCKKLYLQASIFFWAPQINLIICLDPSLCHTFHSNLLPSSQSNLTELCLSVFSGSLKIKSAPLQQHIPSSGSRWFSNYTEKLFTNTSNTCFGIYFYGTWLCGSFKDTGIPIARLMKLLLKYGNFLLSLQLFRPGVISIFFSATVQLSATC